MFKFNDTISNKSYTFDGGAVLDGLVFRSPYPHEHVIVSSVVVTVIMLVIVLGNVLVIVAVARDRNLRGPQNWFVASLAMSDILVGLFIMPLSLANELMGYWAFGDVLCELWLATDVLLCTASILNLVLISLDRYWSITMAMTYIRRRTARLATALIAIVWGLSMVICLPPLVGWKRPQPTLLGGYAQCVLSEEPGYVVYSTVGSFYIPLCVMILVYLKIFLVTRRRARRNLIRRNTSFRKDRPACCGGGQHVSVSRDPDINSLVKTEINPAAVPQTVQEFQLPDLKEIILQDGARMELFIEQCVEQQSVVDKLQIIDFQTKCTDHAPRTVYTNETCPIDIRDIQIDSAENKHTREEYGQRFLVRYESATSAASSDEYRRLISVSGSSAGSGTSPTILNQMSHCILTNNFDQSGSGFAAEVDDNLFSKQSDVTRFLPENIRDSNRENKDLYCSKYSSFITDSPKPLPTALILNTAATTARAILNKLDSHKNSLDDPCDDELMTPSPERRRKSEDQLRRRGGGKRKSKIAKQLRTAQYLASSNLAIMGQTIMRHRNAAAGRVDEDEKARALQDPQLTKRRLARAKERRAFLVLGVVMAAFVGCWMPFFSVYLVVSLIGVEVPPLVFAVFFWLGYCNSALNPFIYTIFNRDFRRAFHRIVCGKKAIGRF